MSFDDFVIITLIASNSVWIAYALTLRSKNCKLKAQLFHRTQWNWRQAKQWKN